MTKFRLPWISTIFILAISLTSLVAERIDNSHWAEITDQFQQQFMPEEIIRYENYLQRQASLNRQSVVYEQKVKALHKLQSNMQDHHAIAKMILQDLAYRDYITREGHLFIDPWTFAAWKVARQEIDEQIDALLTHQLSINKSSVASYQLLTHSFVSNLDWLSLALLSCLFMALLILEQMLTRLKLMGFILVFICLEGVLSQFNPTQYQAYYNGFEGLLVFSLSLAIFNLFPREQVAAHQAWIRKLVFAVTIISVAGIALSILTYASLSATNLIFILIATLLSLLLARLDRQVVIHEDKQHSASVSTTIPWEQRAGMAKAADFISRFEFNSAKQVLHRLMKEYPDSPEILEQRYLLAKLQPNDINYPNLSAQLIDLCVRRQDYARLKSVFTDIQKNNKQKTSAAKFLESGYYLKMLMVFIQHGDLEKAEQVFHFLELNADTAMQREACRLLMDKYKALQNHHKHSQYEMLLKRLNHSRDI